MPHSPTPPAYLGTHADLWRRSPREANRAWFREAGFGLFIHYGLYSQLKRHEWVLHREAIPLVEYERLFDTFRPVAFDAEFITDLALDAGMRYVNLTACHHEGFCRMKQGSGCQGSGENLTLNPEPSACTDRRFCTRVN